MSRSVRFMQLEQLLISHPEGLRKTEIAQRLGVHKSTIGRDITDLSTSLPLIEEDDGRIRIDKNGYLHTVRLTLHEMQALHLAARLYCKVMRFPFPHASAALRKLADAQENVSPGLSDRIRETAEELDTFTTENHEHDQHYRTTIEKLGLAISEKRKVRLRHYSRRREIWQEYRLFPITLEPHPEGKAVHLVGWDIAGGSPFFRTLKTERIDKIVLEDPANEEFDRIPTDEISALFEHAWSIWRSTEAPVRVRLRFSRDVAFRVKETQWHRSQELTEKNDGSLILQVKVAEPQEMYPWIRGWGPKVEVLEPEWLRNQHRIDFQRGYEIYENNSS